MDWKEFLKLDWKKFVIPSILIIVFMIFISWFFAVSKPLEKHGCEMIELYNRLANYRERNDTLGMNKTITELESLRNQIREEIDSSTFLFKDIDDVRVIYDFIIKIDPAFPTPCSISTTKNCRYFISKSTYDCMIESYRKGEATESLFGLIEPQELPPYNKLSTLDLSLNIVILFSEGYLFSCLISWIYNKVKKK